MKEIVKAGFSYLDCLIKPALTELGETVADSVKVFRYKRQLKLEEDVKRIHQKRGITEPKQIPIKTFANLLSASSLEEDELLSDMWANLLANSTDPKKELDYCNVFVKILSELSSQEARVLDHFYTKARSKEYVVLAPISVQNFLNGRKENRAIIKGDTQRYLTGELICNNLERLGLVKFTIMGNRLVRKEEYQLTVLGIEFMKECAIEDSHSPS